MISLTDTHCHIHSIGVKGGERITAELWSKLDTTQSLVIKRARSADVGRLITVGCDLGDSQLAISVASKFDNVWASIGIHPHEAGHYPNHKPKLEEFKRLVNKPKIVAIGECGLDYYYDHSDRNAQKEILEFQLNVAEKYNLPVIFHVREAFKDFWPIFDGFKNIRGVLHSFTDSQANLDRAIKKGLYVGVNGIATFTKDAAQTAMYKAVPIQNLLLETDSPFLTPAPLRGSINEPKNVRLVAEYLASLRGENLETLSGQTTDNARILFKL